MKKFVNPIPIGGLPIHNEDLNRAESQETSEELLKGLNEPCVLSGCGDLDSDESAGRVNLYAGKVFLNGEVMDIEQTPSFAYMATAPVYICEDIPTYEQRLFKDNTNKNATVIRKAKYSLTPPVSGQYITCNVYPKRFKDVVLGSIPATLVSHAGTINSHTATLSSHTGTLATHSTTLTNHGNSITDLYNTKANIAQPAWQNFTINSPFSDGAGSTQYSPSFMKDTMGFVHLRGRVNLGNTTNSGIMFTLPVGFRPLKGYTMRLVGAGGYMVLMIQDDGDILITPLNQSSSDFDLFEIPSFFAEQ